MRRLAALLASAWLLAAAWTAQAAEPLLRVRASLGQASDVMAGATVTLRLDVLTSTWFADPPALPDLRLPRALVTPPSGRAEILHEQDNGVAMNGLRYTYVITPQAAGPLDIPALTVSARLGQASGPLSASSAPLRLAVREAAGPGVAAQALQATQAFETSAVALTVGGRVTRSITQRAQGAQAMLIKPAPLGDVAGFRRYAREPEIRNLDDGRGGFVGGERVDRADYVAERAGTLSLPALRLDWVDGATGKPAVIELPAQSFDVAPAPGAASPFPIEEDVRQWVLHIPAAALWGTAVLAALALAGWLGWPSIRRAARALGERGRAWRASEPWAWRQLRREMGRPGLGSFYLWLRRASGQVSLGQAQRGWSTEARAPALAMLRADYGQPADAARAQALLRQHAPRWRKRWRAARRAAPRHGLRPLNRVGTLDHKGETP
ncbi:protein BatD [Bordetella hinzii]|uniref:BatD family protein n=1 Tax=Bordetella hinzii TaxID=103855 RepID=UPI0013EFDF21|nr:BatD family protein [Bordetella hinzii]QII85494.1 protein BatD [Bordetella hinzii]